MQNDYSLILISFVEKEYAICFEKFKYYGRQRTKLYELKEDCNVTHQLSTGCCKTTGKLWKHKTETL